MAHCPRYLQAVAACQLTPRPAHPLEMTTKSRQRIYGASIRASAQRAKEAPAAAHDRDRDDRQPDQRPRDLVATGVNEIEDNAEASEERRACKCEMRERTGPNVRETWVSLLSECPDRP
jgi:hypothetical protein